MSLLYGMVDIADGDRIFKEGTREQFPSLTLRCSAVEVIPSSQTISKTHQNQKIKPICSMYGIFNLQNWLTLNGQMLVNILAPWGTCGKNTSDDLYFNSQATAPWDQFLRRWNHLGEPGAAPKPLRFARLFDQALHDPEGMIQ